MDQNYKMLKSSHIEYVEFKIMIQSIPEEPEIVEHNYYEEYLKEKVQQAGPLAPEMGEVSPNNYQFESNNPSFVQPGAALHQQAASPANPSPQEPSPRSRDLSRASHSPLAEPLHSESRAGPEAARQPGSRRSSGEQREAPAQVQPAIRIEPPSFVDPSEDSRLGRQPDQPSIGQRPQLAGLSDAHPSQAPSHRSSASNPFASLPNIKPPNKPQDSSLKTPAPSNSGSRLEDDQQPQVKPALARPTPTSFRMEEDDRARQPKPPSALKPPSDGAAPNPKKRIELTLSPKLGGLKKAGERAEEPKADPGLQARVEKEFENEQQLRAFKHKLLAPRPAAPKEMEQYLETVDRDNKQMKQALKHISDNLDDLSQEQLREKQALADKIGKMHQDAQKLRQAFGDDAEDLRNPRIKSFALTNNELSSRVLDSVQASFGETARKVGVADSEVRVQLSAH